MFGDQCCTFIPNNTAPGGAFSEVMTKIKKLRAEVTANAGRDKQIWDWIDLKFGAWGAWFAKLGMFFGSCCTSRRIVILLCITYIENINRQRYG